MLDTSVCVAVMRGHARATACLVRFAPDDCVISSVAAYELFTGLIKCRDLEREQGRVQRLLSVVRMAAFDEAAAEHAARIRAELEKAGQVCGPYDLLVAGHALSLGLPLATNNVREFSRVSGLLIEDWIA